MSSSELFDVEPYAVARKKRPQTGKHILALFDTDCIVVYAAFNRDIAEHAVAEQAFGGRFSFSRMSWIKPSFLWMMERSGWATKPNQEHVLAIGLRPSVFEDVLQQSVHSHYQPARYASEAAWKEAIQRSDVRLQWDPDRDARGRRLRRRTIQVGLRGEALRRYNDEGILHIRDITPFVEQQRRVRAQDELARLQVPAERVWLPDAPDIRSHIFNT